MRKTIASTLVVLMLAVGFNIATAAPAAAAVCPTSSTTYDWNGPHATCEYAYTFAAENWGNGPYGNGVFYRHPAYGYYPAYCFGRTTLWLGNGGAGSTGYLHQFWMKEDLDGNCNGPYANRDVSTYVTLQYFNIYGVEEALAGEGSGTFCGTNPTNGYTAYKAGTGGFVQGTAGDVYNGNWHCIPLTTDGGDWKPGYYRVKQRMYVLTAPYFSFDATWNIYSDHHVCLPGADC
jgi:hypothetical protein